MTEEKGWYPGKFLGKIFKGEHSEQVTWEELARRFEELKKRPPEVIGLEPLIRVTREEAEWIALQAIEELKRAGVPITEAWMFGVFPKSAEGRADIDFRVKLKPGLTEEEIYMADRKCEKLMLIWMTSKGILAVPTLYEKAGMPYEPFKKIYP